MATDRRKILETVKKLIVHAENKACTREERIAFTAKISALMREYRIERAEVEPSVIDAADFSQYGLSVVTYPTSDPSGVPWQAFMYQVIAEANACQCIFISDATGSFMVAGHVVDRAVTIALSRQLVNSIGTLGQQAYAEALYADAAVMMGIVTPAQYHESYRTGFIQAVRDRLVKEEAEEVREETALIKLKDAVVKTNKFLEKRISGERGEVSAQIELHHRGAAERGYMDGKRADLGKERIEGGNEKPLKEIAK